MDYEKLYYAIINKALRKQITGQRFKGDGVYYESHHIKPRSLGGLDDERNLVLLTAKEHYLCHWLLVKRYDVKSLERKKMIKAWYIMAAVGKTKRPKRNMNVYAKYRNEMGETMSAAQSGKRNSQYGKHWYTSIDTGESKNFFEKPNDRWIEGRNWFNNEGKNIYDIKTKTLYDFGQQQRSLKNNLKDKKNAVKINCYDPYRKKFITVPEWIYLRGLETAKKRWNEYHSGNFCQIKEYAKKLGMTSNAISNMFIKYIPLFAKQKKKFNFSSNKALINVFE